MDWATPLKDYDVELYNAMQGEAKRQRDHIELIASENYVSPRVLEAVGSVLTNKYAEGKPGRRYYGGCEYVDVVERLAVERVKKLFGCDHANVQAHSGANANLIVFYACLNAGDTVMGMSLDAGGHLSHGTPMNISGKMFNSVPYGVDSQTELMDYEAIRKQALEVKPKLIVCGASAYPRKIDFKKFREIADEVGAYLLADISHIAGLIVAGEHENPVPYCDFVTTTTHKTLRGTRGGVVMCKEQYVKMLDSATFPGIQGGPLEHVIAGKAVAFKEALSDEFKEYGHQVILNAKAMADRFIENGVKLVSGGTDNHLMILNLVGSNVTGKELEALLDSANITANKNAIPNDPLSTFVTSGLRIGTPACTTRGMKEAEMVVIADLVTRVIREKEECIEEVKAQVLELLARFPLKY